MLAVTLILGIAILALLSVIAVRLDRLGDVLEANTQEVRELRLTSRTRIRDYSVQSGEVSAEQSLTRLGRASAAQRVVFGGDDDSDLHQDLVRQSKVGHKRGGDDDG
jgi:hypothetical protein